VILIAYKLTSVLWQPFRIHCCLYTLFFMCSVFEGLSLLKFMQVHYMWYTLIYSCFVLWCYETVLLVDWHYQFGGTLLTIHQEYGVVTQKTTIWSHTTVKSSDLYTIFVSHNWTHNKVLSSTNYYYVMILEGFDSYLAYKKFGVWMSNYFNM